MSNARPPSSTTTITIIDPKVLASLTQIHSILNEQTKAIEALAESVAELKSIAIRPDEPGKPNEPIEPLKPRYFGSYFS
jgi:hypothetical protein